MDLEGPRDYRLPATRRRRWGYPLIAVGVASVLLAFTLFGGITLALLGGMLIAVGINGVRSVR